jgi:hypothetical protein
VHRSAGTRVRCPQNSHSAQPGGLIPGPLRGLSFTASDYLKLRPLRRPCLPCEILKLSLLIQGEFSVVLLRDSCVGMAEQQGYSLQWHSGQEVTGGKGMSEAVRMRPVGEGFSRARARLCLNSLSRRARQFVVAVSRPPFPVQKKYFSLLAGNARSADTTSSVPCRPSGSGI